MRRLILVCVLVLMSGCATRQTHEHASNITDPSLLRVWSAQGRMGITGVPQSGSGSFNWSQRDDVSQLNMHGPLGVGAISMRLDSSAHITLANGTHYNGDDALIELAARLGVSVPLQQLKFWLRGVPAPGEFQWLDDVGMNRSNSNKILQQDGWRIQYDDSILVDALQLPRKITATQNAVRIRVVIEEWKLQ